MGHPEPLIREVRPDERTAQPDEYGSGALEEISAIYDQDAEVLAANLGWE